MAIQDYTGGKNSGIVNWATDGIDPVTGKPRVATLGAGAGGAAPFTPGDPPPYLGSGAGGAAPKETTGSPLPRAADTSGSAPPLPGATAASSAMPAGMDPALAAIYQGSGLDPAGDGSGFADWQYWQNVGPSQYDRLKADIAGTGSDQPTGTPGAGAWLNSGRNSGGGGNAAMSGFSASAAPTWTGSVMDGAPGSADAGSLFQTLMARANQGLNVDANDPIIRNQVNAYDAAQTRAERTGEAQDAERGGQHANIDAERRGRQETAGQNTAGFQAQLMGQELTARRAEIQQALTGAQGFLTAQQQMQLQEELAKMDVALRQYQFGQSQGQQESQFSRDLSQRAFEYDTTDQFRNSPLYGG